jgi:hypothetical protein
MPQRGNGDRAGAKVAKVLVRVSPEWKSRAEGLASSRGLTLSELIRQAAEASLRELRDAKAPIEKPEGWLLLAVERASRSYRGYSEVGNLMAQEAASRENVGELEEAVRRGDRRAAWRWFLENYPEEMELVPHRTERRRAFLEGVWQALGEA